jgi:hypothetical protein
MLIAFWVSLHFYQIARRNYPEGSHLQIPVVLVAVSNNAISGHNRVGGFVLLTGHPKSEVQTTFETS